jgi:UDP-N-acetylmuramate dehydrogenase
VQINRNTSLKYYNTFGIDVKAAHVIELTHLDDWKRIPNPKECLILGGGSNVLLTSDLEKTVVLNRMRGIETVSEDEDSIQLKVASGENWHDFVIYCVNKGFGGIENLSLIPGSVGAAPMQNIGAYGVEIKDVLVSVDAFDLEQLELKTFTNSACEFGYRESIFKKEAKGRFFIASATLQLTKKNHTINTSYGAIKDTLNAKGISHPTIKDVSDTVIAIRQSKLPDPAELGNSGSFFKNPVIDKAHFEKLQVKFPEIKSYPVDEQHFKIPAGWLIESLGWKGKVVGNTGSHKNQALVLVNYGNASGQEVKQLSDEIKQSVYETYQIHLETEVNII